MKSILIEIVVVLLLGAALVYFAPAPKIEVSEDAVVTTHFGKTEVFPTK